MMLYRYLPALIVCALASSLFPASSHAQSAPAVSALNGKVSVEGGSAGSQGRSSATGLAQGSITTPLGHSFGLQLDGAAGIASGNVNGGGALHGFWRDPAVGMFGPVAMISGANGVRTTAYVAEGEWYAGVVTLGGFGGYINTVSDTYGRASDGGFWSGRLTLYPIPDLALSAHAISAVGRYTGRGTIEYQPQLAAMHNTSFFVDGWRGDDRYRVTFGIRFYFGADKPLIRRHREDDPQSMGAVPPGMELENSGSTSMPPQIQRFASGGGQL